MPEKVIDFLSEVQHSFGKEKEPSYLYLAFEQKMFRHANGEHRSAKFLVVAGFLLCKVLVHKMAFKSYRVLELMQVYGPGVDQSFGENMAVIGYVLTALVAEVMFQEFKGILATEYYGHQNVSLDGKELAIKKRIFSDLLVKDVGDGAAMFMQFEFLMEQVEWLPLV